MTGKAFFRPSSVRPRLVRRWDELPSLLLPSRSTTNNTNCNISLEVWNTTCIVTNFGLGTQANCEVLVNPGNPQLSGTSNFPYFPRGGPVPPESTAIRKGWTPLGFVSQWGGMSVGSGMLFPVSVVDGLVHLHGGTKLKLECQWQRLVASGTGNGEACPMGSAVVTSAGGLSASYRSIIHTAPPFYNPQHNDNRSDEDSVDLLGNCYKAALDKASDLSSSSSLSRLRVAIPLLGSGARGFPYDVAMSVAVKSCLEWCEEHQTKDDGQRTHSMDVVFGLLEESHAEEFSDIVETSLLK